MKKLHVLEIIVNFILLLLMFIPLYCFCIAPILLIICNVYFGYKHRNKFVLWRLALVDFILFVGYEVNIYFIDMNNTMPVIDYVSHSILFVPFIIAIILSCITFLIYQLIVLISISKNKDIIN